MQDVCKQLNVEWKPTKNFLIHRLPKLVGFYLFAPGRLPGAEIKGIRGVIKESCSIEAWQNVFSFVLYGFLGVGSI